VLASSNLSKMSLINMLNSAGDNEHPCLNPIFELNSSSTRLPSDFTDILTFL
jgi:hypothetical protein